MQNNYPFQDIENKWQKWWEANGIYHAQQPSSSEKEKYYALVEFPYPSGNGLHVGHPRSYTAIDIVARKKRMMGYNVLYPIGWDAFGLPAENYAIKKKIHPSKITKENINNFKRQIQSLGVSFDWSREINTTDPAYYKWTQWMFIQFYESWFDEKLNQARSIAELHIPEEIENQGPIAVKKYKDERRLAFKQKTIINWCPSCKIGLANEEAQGGICERCGGPVEKKEKNQWMIRITKYADRLIDDLKKVDYLEKIKSQQINWIGRSKGALINFSLKEQEEKIEVFTTRADTLFGVTYLVLAPEHQLLKKLLDSKELKNKKEIQKYIKSIQTKSDIERQENKEKTGVRLEGVQAINPINNEEISIWVADYVLPGYGTGAIMAVPAHDDRDYAFAKKFDIPIIKVIQPPEGNTDKCYHGDGEIINSDFLNGLSTKNAQAKVITWLEKNNLGHQTTNYRLRDWVFSRQRYWGEPIPMVYCEQCGWTPVKDSELPVLLPEVKKYEPTATGESPLADMEEWKKTICPICGQEATRETDTMPNWAGSSWYFLRYTDPHNNQEFSSAENLEYWMPVDLYNGGMEHTTLHLLYSRFWYKFLYDLKFIPVSCGDEPYKVRRSHAMILGDGGIKMSKSKGNVINPDDIVAEYGADIFRLYEMFMGPYDQDASWDTKGIQGMKRFVDKAWKIITSQIKRYKRDQVIIDPEGVISIDLNKIQDYERILHQTIKKVGEDIDRLHFNTAISQLMILTNKINNLDITPSDLKKYLQILAPFAPHLAEEAWFALGYTTSIHVSAWPNYREDLLIDDTITIVVQVNGKVRAEIKTELNSSKEDLIEIAKQDPKIKKYIQDQEIKKEIYVKNKLINFVI